MIHDKRFFYLFLFFVVVINYTWYFLTTDWVNGYCFCFLSFATSPTMIPAWSFVCGLPKKVVPTISVRGFVWIPQKLWLIIVFRAKIASTIFTYDNWLVIRNIFYFSIYWESSSQVTFIFCRGVHRYTTNQRNWVPLPMTCFWTTPYRVSFIASAVTMTGASIRSLRSSMAGQND